MTAHLFLGQVHDDAAPSTVAAEIYLWSDSFGMGTGTDTPLFLETDDIAPAGPGARVLGRRIFVPIRYWSGCTIRVTPIIDLNQLLTSITQQFSTSATPKSGVVTVMLATHFTYVRVRIEVIARDGLVEIYGPSVAFKAVAPAHRVAEAQA